MLIFGERIFCCVITRSYLAQCFCNGWKSAFQPAKRSIPDIQLATSSGGQMHQDFVTNLEKSVIRSIKQSQFPKCIDIRNTNTISRVHIPSSHCSLPRRDWTQDSRGKRGSGFVPGIGSYNQRWLLLVEVKETSRWSLQWLSNNPSWIDGWVEA